MLDLYPVRRKAQFCTNDPSAEPRMGRTTRRFLFVGWKVFWKPDQAVYAARDLGQILFRGEFKNYR
jgi:hypothetical protein